MDNSCLACSSSTEILPDTCSLANTSRESIFPRVRRAARLDQTITRVSSLAETLRLEPSKFTSSTRSLAISHLPHRPLLFIDDNLTRLSALCPSAPLSRNLSCTLDSSFVYPFFDITLPHTVVLLPREFSTDPGQYTTARVSSGPTLNSKTDTLPSQRNELVSL